MRQNSHSNSHSGGHSGNHSGSRSGNHSGSRPGSHSGNRSRQQSKTPRSEFKTLLFFYILPFIVVNSFIFYLATAKPKYTLDVSETNDYLSTTVTLTIDSHLPTRNLSLTLNGEVLPLEETDRKTYTASITQNGTIEAYLENFNGMSVVQFENISVLDDRPPEVKEFSVEDDILTIQLSDSQSGIDFSSIHAIDSTGKHLTPASVNKSKSEVTFEMDKHGLTMYVSDLCGNQVEQPFSVSETD